MNWHTKPIVRLLLPFMGGILACGYFQAEMTILFIPLLISFGFTYLLANKTQSFKYRWGFGVALTIFFFCFGYLLCYYNNDAVHKNHFANHLTGEKDEIFVGVISDIPKYGKWTKIKLDLQTINRTNTRNEKIDGTIEVLIESDSTKKQLKYGDLLAIPASNLKKIESPKNPNSFNYKRYSYFQNIHYQCFIRKNNYKILESNQGNYLFTFTNNLRFKFLDVLKKHIPKNEELAVSSALILGYKHDLNDKIRNAYAETGAMHVLAVSGLHVGIVYMIMNFLLARIKSYKSSIRFIKLAISLLGIWFFVLITGSAPSVIRAAIMFSLITIGKHIDRDSYIYNTIAASAFFILLFEPYQLFQVGFQLSYLAILGIIFFFNKIRKFILIKNDYLNNVWEMTVVGIAAQITVIPICVFYFGKIPVYFWLTGFIVVFAATIILSLGLLLFALEFTIPFLAEYIGMLLNEIITLLNQFIYLIHQLPYGVIDNISIGSTFLTLLYLTLLSAIFWLRFENKLWLKVASSILFASSIWYSVQQYQNYRTKEIIVYDAGKDNTIIDFIYNQKVISLVNSKVDDSKLNYTTTGNRNAYGINNIKTINLDSTDYYKNGVFIWQKPFIQFYDKKLMIVDSKIKNISDYKTEIDLVLMRKNAKINIEELNQVIDYQQVIVDNSNNYWNSNKWKEDCKNQEITFNDSKNGAVILPIK